MGIKAFHALARFGLGEARGELDVIGNDPRGWLIEQLKNPVIPSNVQMRYGGCDLINQIRKLGGKDPEKRQELSKELNKVYVKETSERTLAQKRSSQPFIERLVLFWSNHFTVSIQKDLISGIVNQYEVEAIRPNINGTFFDMLLSVVRHPAMLHYLDNAQSIGYNSVAGKKRAKGLNENLAREILELHTLGVNGGYSQQDVIALAKIITGWSIDDDNNDVLVSYKFKPNFHEPDEKILLGKRFVENGESEGVDALMMLARHPATAEHIATKLARHFISDTPSSDSIKKIADSFLRSDGHLPTVMDTLVNLDEAWESPLCKIKNPYEYAVSALRLTEFSPPQEKVIMWLDALNFRPFNASSPAGYDDVESAWLSPDSIMKRVEWGYKLAQRLPKKLDSMQLSSLGMSDVLSDLTKNEIERAASVVDAVGLLLASPEFQRR